MELKKLSEKDKKIVKKAPKNFTGIQKLIFSLFLVFDHPKFSLADLYVKQWNILNYFIIGGVGVIINYSMFFMFVGSLGWEITNIIAIGTAMLWNWSNSVGIFCEYWGYTKNE